MSTKQYRSAPFEVKDMDTKTGAFTGYASVFGNLDSYRDVIDQGAFKKTLDENGHRVKVLWQHDPTQPIGRPTVMREDDRGLYVEAKISQTAHGRDVLVLMEDGVINELSIGYSAVKDTFDSKLNIRRLTEVKLWEFSAVTWAANDLALIEAVKAQELPEALRHLGGLTEELKAGRVLSAANRGLIEQALATLLGANEALTALLDASEPGAKAATPDALEPPPEGSDPDTVQSVLTLLSAMRTYSQGVKNA